MVILYTTGCPQCKVLKAKLDSKNIEYTIVDDVDKMLDLGLMSAPNLRVNDNMFNFNFRTINISIYFFHQIHFIRSIIHNIIFY